MDGNLIYYLSKFLDSKTKCSLSLVSKKFVNNIFYTNDEITEKFTYACKIGDINIFKKFLYDGRVDKWIIEAWGIMKASEFGQGEIVDLLLNDNRVDPIAKDGDGYNAFGLACEHNHINVVQRLLLDPRVNINDNDNYSLTIAVELGHVEIVKLLLSDKRLELTGYLEDEIFEIAAIKGHTSLIELFLNDENFYPYENNFILPNAVRNRNYNMVDVILKNSKVNPIIPDEEGVSPIEYAFREGYSNIVIRFLQDDRIDVNYYDLQDSVINGYKKEIFQILLNSEKLHLDEQEVYDLIDDIVLHKQYHLLESLHFYVGNSKPEMQNALEENIDPNILRLIYDLQIKPTSIVGRRLFKEIFFCIN